MAGDSKDDKTAISSPGGKRKFLDSSTQLKTAIYQDDATTKASPVSIKAIANQPVPEHVSRVLEKAEELLAGLSKRNAAKAADRAELDDATIPTDDDDDDGGPSMLDDVTELQKPRRHAPPASAVAADRETEIAVAPVPSALGSVDVSVDASVDELIDMSMELEPDDSGVLGRADTGIDLTTQVAPAPVADDGAPPQRPTIPQRSGPSLDLDKPPLQPTIPKLGGALSSEPIGPGPLAEELPPLPKSASQRPLKGPSKAPLKGPSPSGAHPLSGAHPVPGPVLPNAHQNSPLPAARSQAGPLPPQPSGHAHAIQQGQTAGGPDMVPTISTESAPMGLPVPQHMQPRPALTPSPKKSFFGGIVRSVKRLFGRAEPPPPPIAPPPEEDFSGYGAGTYTAAGRHVARRHERDRDDKKS